MTGEAQAAFNGFERHELGDKRDPVTGLIRIGDVYLYESAQIWADAVHELTHAAAHHVREIRGGDLAEPNDGEFASDAEEMLCRCTEYMIVDLFVLLARFKSRPKIRSLDEVIWPP